VEIHQIPALRNPVMVVAFSGWNDVAEAATGALDYLLQAWKTERNEVAPQLIAEIDPEEFYDFQVNRPLVFTDGTDGRIIKWPTTEIFSVVLPHCSRDLIVVKGAEPSMRWRTFSSELLDFADDLEVSMVVAMGATLADVPHTRPIDILLSALTPEIASRLSVENSAHIGATGILNVIQDSCARRGIDAIAMWAPVPHYASNAPSPKASLSLIHALEDLLAIAIPQDELAALADSWEMEISNLANEDADISDYIKALEKSKDAEAIPEASGEMIAKEFERYLRRRRSD
jgi:proteasome assembly chaperone (PAC2) family protein